MASCQETLPIGGRDADAGVMTSTDIHTGLRGTVSVALDPSRPAPPALEVARRVAEQAGYQVELVAATPPDLDVVRHAPCPVLVVPGGG